jgi:hypothetical protein
VPTALRRLHLIVGLAALIGFLLTGQYMDLRHAHLVGMADAPRMLHRSAHIYLLLAALLNLALGLYLRLESVPWRRGLQVAGSVLILATPFLFAIAFFREPWLADLVRPWARPGIYLSLAGGLMHLASRAGAGATVSPDGL